MDSRRDKVQKALFEIGADIELANEFEAALAIYGLLIVPIEATEEMIAVGQASLDFAPIKHTEEQARKVWDAMLVATCPPEEAANG